MLYEAFAGGWLLQSASSDVSLSLIPSSVLNLVDSTKRLKITAIAGGGGTYGYGIRFGDDIEGGHEEIRGGWGEMTNDYYPNPMTDIAINIGGSSGVYGTDDVCVKGNDTIIGSLVSLMGGRTKCHLSSTSGHSAASGIVNIPAGFPGSACREAASGMGSFLCYNAGAGGYVKIEVE